MRHSKSQRVFGREVGQRTALLRTLAVSLIEKGSIQTTEAKAKELRPYVEKLVTKARTGTLASRRLIESRLGQMKASKRLVEVIGPKFKERNGGYLRITKLGLRRTGDGAKEAIISFVEKL